METVPDGSNVAVAKKSEVHDNAEHDTAGILAKHVRSMLTTNSKCQTHNCNVIKFMNMTEERLAASTTVETKAYAPDK